MNVGKIIERSAAKVVKKDVFGKETYPGDIIIFPKDTCRFQVGIIEKFTPQGISVIPKGNFKHRIFFYDHKDFLNITNRFEKFELEQFDDLKQAYLDFQKKEKNEKITSRYVFALVLDEEGLNWGFCYFKCDSKPGKNITADLLKEFKNDILSFFNEKYKVLFFTKNYELTSCFLNNVICSSSNYGFREYLKTPKNIYWASSHKGNTILDARLYYGIQFLSDFVQSFKSLFYIGYKSQRDTDLRNFCKDLDNQFMNGTFEKIKLRF